MSRGNPESVRSGNDLTHVDAAGRAQMVNVTGKAWTHRRAVARGRVNFDLTDRTLWAKAREATGAKSDAAAFPEIFRIATLAALQAAKRTSTWIPLCHPLAVSRVNVELGLGSRGVDIEAAAEVVGPTGVEMEALTACTVAALSVVALLGPTSGASIEDVELWEKSGGKSGNWVRP